MHYNSGKELTSRSTSNLPLEKSRRTFFTEYAKSKLWIHFSTSLGRLTGAAPEIVVAAVDMGVQNVLTSTQNETAQAEKH